MDQNIKAAIERLKDYSVPEISDGMEVFHTMDFGITEMVTTEKVIGKAVTVDVPVGEGATVTRAIELAKEGDVIVIGGHGHCKSSYWGDHRSFCAKINGVAGVIVDGAFRDIEGCEEIGVPIFARAVTPGTALKTGQGKINVAISCGGIIVRPGDIIVGDRNGVCVVDVNEVDEIIRKADRKRLAQAYTRQEMKRLQKVIPKIIYPED
jgi:regulator of RNase E activity RraA